MKPVHSPAAPETSRDLPPFPAAPGGHHPALDVFRPQEKVIFTGVVVAARGNPRRHHTDNAVHDRVIRPWRQEKNHIADPQGPVTARHDLHHLRLAQRGVHAGAEIRSEEYRARANSTNIFRITPCLAHVPSRMVPGMEDYADFVPRRDMGKRPASSACRQNQNGAHNRPSE